MTFENAKELFALIDVRKDLRILLDSNFTKSDNHMEKSTMSTQLLRDKDVFPSPEVLQNVLGKRYAVLKELFGTITNEDYGLTFEWRFYNDGKAWLGKAVYKKKTIFWLSVWDGYFQTGFYFTEKTRNGVMDLNIDDGVKSAFAQAEATEKLVPLSLKIDKKQQLKDVLEIVKYKKTLK